MQKLVISFILVFVLIGLDSTSYTQELSKIRAGKKKIIKLLNKSKDEDYLEKKLKSFDTTILRQLLKDYKISVKDKNKSELIELIIEKIPLLLNKTNQGKMKITKEKKEKTKEKKTENQDRRSEIKNIESKKSNKFITYQAERIYAIDKEDEKGFRKIFLFGHVVIEFHSKTLYADAVSIKINKEDEPIEVVAQGDLLIEDKKYHRIIGKKMYFFPQIKRGIIFSANALNNPFYLTGKRGNQIDKSKYIMYDGNMTSCNLAYPHYSLNYSKAWYYDEEQIWAINVEYNIGDTALFYFPFFFRSAETTGIRTAFGYEKGIGWFLHNTLVYVPGKSIAESRKALVGNQLNPIEGRNVAMKFKGDYYQKMGLYFGYELAFKEGSHNIRLDSAVAMDRSLKYIGGSRILTNYFDQDGDGKPEETNNFRWRIKIDGDHNLFTSSSGLNSTFKYGFKTQGEPYFQSQFESRRKLDFDVFDLFGDTALGKILGKETNQDVEGASRGFSTVMGQEINFSLTNKIDKLSLTISGNFNYVLQRDITNIISPPNNPFKTNSYKNFKSIFTFPQIKINYSDFYQIFGKDKPKTLEQKQKEDEKKKQEEEKFLKEYQLGGTFTSLDKEKTKTDQISTTDPSKKDELILSETKRKNKLVINLPLTYTFSSNLVEKKSYNTTENNNLASDIFNTDNNIQIGTPFTLTYQFLVFKINNSESLKNITQKTKNATSIQSLSDTEQSYASWNTNLGSDLEFHFFDQYEYLELILTSGVNYTKSDRFDKIIKENSIFKNEAGRAETIGFNSSFTFFKTKFSVTLSDNLYINAANLEKINMGLTTREAVLKDQKGNLVLTAHSETLKFLTVDNSFTRSRRENKDLSNTLNISYKILGRTHVLGPVYLSSLTHSLAWFEDFQNPRGSTFSSTFSIDFNISKDWNFLYNATSSNKQLYRYSNKDSLRYGQPSRDLFQDLIDSFNFFDQKKREKSFFNLESMSFKLRHDLHDWMMEFSVDLHVKQFRNGPFYFEPTLYFVIFLKDLPSFRYPKIKHTFTKQ